jgi:Cu-Zn family superoxide dismutase
MRRAVLACVLTAALVLAAGAPAAASGGLTAVSSRFGSADGAYTYDTTAVPGSARAWVLAASGPSASGPGWTGVVLYVRGLLPRHEYGAHVHVNACGPAGPDAGPHYQHVVDPVQPSVDPAYANPRNEIWLAFTTDRWGTGGSAALVPWRFGARRPGSVVLHAMHTHTAPGEAGTAGARLACVTVPF